MRLRTSATCFPTLTGGNETAHLENEQRDPGGGRQGRREKTAGGSNGVFCSKSQSLRTDLSHGWCMGTRCTHRPCREARVVLHAQAHLDTRPLHQRLPGGTRRSQEPGLGSASLTLARFPRPCVWHCEGFLFPWHRMAAMMPSQKAQHKSLLLLDGEWPCSAWRF